MAIVRAYAVCTVFVLALCLPAAPTSAREKPIVWCFGDSIAWQLCRGLVQNGHWAHWDLKNHAVAGETSSEGIRRLEGLLFGQTTPDVVFVQYGTNDILYGVLEAVPGNTAEDVYDRLQAMEAMIERYGSEMIWTTTPVRERPDGAIAELDEYLSRHFDLNRKIKRVTIRSRATKFKDFGHPRQKWVDKVLAPRLARTIKRVLRKKGFATPSK